MLFVKQNGPRKRRERKTLSRGSLIFVCVCFFTIIAAAAAVVAVFGSGVRNSRQHDTRSSASVRWFRDFAESVRFSARFGRFDSIQIRLSHLWLLEEVSFLICLPANDDGAKLLCYSNLENPPVKRDCIAEIFFYF